MKTDIYQIVTDRIIARLEQGEVPWINARTKPLLLARSATTGKVYHGINAFLLSNSCYASAFWATFKTVQAMKGHVKKGEHSSLCVFWKKYETKETVIDKRTGEERRKEVPVLRYYNVFNLEQTEGVQDPLLEPTDIPNPIAKADEVIEAFAGKPSIVFGSSQKAFYSPSTDRIVMPQQSSFTSPSQFYRTYFHELIHSTGHTSRLNRFENEGEHAFSDEARGLEELVAEMGSAMLLAECGIFEETAEKNASYCQHWINELKADPKLIVKAAGRAQKAVDLILGRTHDSEEHAAETDATTAKGAPTAPTPEPEQPIAEPITSTPEPPPAPEPMPVPAEPEPEPPTARPGQLIPGDFVDRHSILRSIDFVGRTLTLEILPAQITNPRPKIRFHDDGLEYFTGESYHHLISDFVTVPIGQYQIDQLYADRFLRALVEYARPRLVGRAKISKVCFKRITRVPTRLV